MKGNKLLQRVSLWIFGIMVIVMISVHLPEQVQAKTIYSGRDADLTWTISDKGKLVISGYGDYEGYNPRADQGDIQEWYAPKWTKKKYAKHVTTVVVKAQHLTNLNHFFENMQNLESVDVSQLDMSRIETMDYTFSKCGLTSVDLTGWDTGYVKSMYCMFRDSCNLKSVDMSDLDVSSVIDAGGMFMGCTALTDVNLGAFSRSKTAGNLKYVGSMFSDCTSMEYLDLNELDVSHVRNMEGMFSGASSLKEIRTESWDTSSVVSMHAMFASCSSLEELDLNSWDISSCNEMEGMFEDCESLKTVKIGEWDTSALTSTWLMFKRCRSLTDLDIQNWNTGKLRYASDMFSGCSSLTGIDLSGWDTIALLEVDDMFSDCAALTSVNLDGWNLRNCKDMRSMFEGCINLQNLSHLDIYDSDLMDTFNGCGKLSADITILGEVPDYRDCFQKASYKAGAETIVNYGLLCSAKECGKIVATKGPKGNVKRGRKIEVSTFADVVDVKNGVKLTWNDMGFADRLVIEKSIDDGKTYDVLFVPEGVAAGYLTDTDVTNGSRYFYRIRAFAGEVEFKNIPEYCVYLTPVKLDPESMNYNESMMYIKCSKNEYADMYVCYIKSDQGYDYYNKDLEPKITYSGKLSNGKKYTFKVAPAVYDTMLGNYSQAIWPWNIPLKIGTMSEACSIYYLNSPKLQSVTKVSAKKFCLEWSKNSKATGYQVQVADNKSMKDAKSYRISDKDILKKEITKKDSNKNYYVRVRSYKVAGEKTWYSRWSERKKV